VIFGGQQATTAPMQIVVRVSYSDGTLTSTSASLNYDPRRAFADDRIDRELAKAARVLASRQAFAELLAAAHECRPLRPPTPMTERTPSTPRLGFGTSGKRTPRSQRLHNRSPKA
jgi:hypothetical protein